MRFLSITKPGIIFGNLVTVLGGFFLASQGNPDPQILFATLLGISLIIASGCVFNNVIDRDIDQLMERTQRRVLPMGQMSVSVALVYATLLGVLGAYVLYRDTTALAFILSLLGLFFYVVVYSLWFKRSSSYGTIIGAVSGAAPPLVGYCAVTNQFDINAALLFLILFFWQMPHFYAIAIYRLSDYQAAGIPVLPAVKKIRYTKISSMGYIGLFTAAAVSLARFGLATAAYGAVALVLGVSWFVLGLRGFSSQEDRAWARKMFLFSIINITFLSMAMAMY